MATKDLGVRFTEEKYATKNEVSRDLGISLIDNIWSNILAYRSTFNRILTLRRIEGNKFTFCYCASISDFINQVEFKAIRAMQETMKATNSNKDDKVLFEKQAYVESLRYVAKVHKLDVTDAYLRSIIDDEVKDLTNSYAILRNYYNALKYVENAFVNPVDDNFLAEIFARINNLEEIVTFYRTDEDKSKDNRVLIDRIYTSAPTGLIESLMNTLFDFIANSSLSVVTKAVITYYYINYVKPFSQFNDEIAVLMMKAVIAHNDIGEVAAMLPLERFLSDKLDENSRMCVEVQKTGDLTYFINFGVKFFADMCDDYLNSTAAFIAGSLRRDFYKSDEPKKEEIKPVEETAPIKEEPRQPQVVAQPQVQVAEQPQLAVNYIPPALDEKEAYRLEQDLLESDPALKKGEAYFYARHCTLNKRYTIAQYKKALGCAYETARTSMEHLFKLGYYRKEMIKNKFVYTPVNRR